MNSAGAAVEVTTGARLHFGPLNWPGPHRTDRPDFGGVGLMIDTPATVVRARPSRPDDAIDWADARPSLAEAVRRTGQPLPAISIASEATRHVGLGSGTQRELAIAAVCGLPRDAKRLASATGRGRRSAIGVHGFCRGGLLLDGGRPQGEPLGVLERRIDFPAWPLHLVRLSDRSGLFGPEEAAAFDTLAAMPAATAARLRQLAEAMFAAVDADSQAAFAAALTEYGCLVGDFFAPAQGGRFADPQWDELLPTLEAEGCGLAQSSWGPSVLVVGAFDPALLADAAFAQPVRARNDPATITPR